MTGNRRNTVVNFVNGSTIQFLLLRW
jgi:hypothetical protein